MSRAKAVKGVLWTLTGMAVMVAIARFTRGLGATTNLTDSTPWGFWIGFDVMAGVALAAGGFVLAGAVYVFGLERYRPLLRATVLTAFLGYLAVAIGLTFDLGVPWRIVHPMIPRYWQYHSVLFEVAMCVILYLNVLALEFAPAALEHKLAQLWSPLRAIYRLLKKLTLPLVILGIMLSTLHQSSLGSLFVIMPHRAHPLWYSPGIFLPLSYFVSAIALGMMMITLENYVSGWIYGHKPRLDLLSGLGRAASIVLAAYLAIRLLDLWHRGVLPGAVDGSWQGWLFLFEVGISAAVPAAVLAAPGLRRNSKALFTCSLMVVLGMVMYRLDSCIIAMKRWPGTSYFPGIVEIMVSVGIVSGLGLVFMYFVENLDVFPESMKLGEKKDLETGDYAKPARENAPIRGVVTGTVDRFMAFWFVNQEPFQKPEFSRTTRVWLGNPFHEDARKYSMLLILGLALTAAVLPQRAIFGFQYEDTPVKPARMISRDGGDILKIDGNLADEYVLFNHTEHEEMTGGKDGCVDCHHMNLPEAMGSPCSSCHLDMYKQSSAFDHELHQAEFGGNDGCVECHPRDKNPANARSCVSCHREMYPDAPEGAGVDYLAPSYMDAMHGKCEACHREEAKKQAKPALGLCSNCHRGDEESK